MGIEKEVFEANDDIKRYLGEEFSALLKHPDFENTLPGLLDNETSSAMVTGKITFIAGLK